MAKKKKDKDREKRIRDEIIVDAYGPEEQAIGWYYYLQDNCRFAFTATCITYRPISPLLEGDEVDILEMAPEEECGHEMFVYTRWRPKNLAVPLSQVKPIRSTDEETKEAVADWHYWVDQGYQF